jgi:hypothetical protein
MRRPIFIALALFICGETASLETNSYAGIDGKLVKSNAEEGKSNYRHNRYGVRPFLGFKISDDIALEVAHEWTPPGLFRQVKEGVNVSASATSALVSASLEKPCVSLPDIKWFVSGGVSHTKIRVLESSSNNKVLGYGKVARTVPALTAGLKKELGDGLSARIFLDWKGTKGMKIERLQHPKVLHTFKNTYGFGFGFKKEF